MKRVAINAVIWHEQSGGLGVYIQKLVEYLTCHKLNFVPVIFVSKNYYQKNPDFAKNPFIKVLNISAYKPVKRILREPFFWPVQIKKKKIDLFFSPMSYIPLGVNIPSMLTIHDLRSFHFREYYSFIRRWYLKKMIRRSANKAKKILTVSHFTSKDIIDTLGVNPNKIKVIYEGLDKERFSIKYTKQELGEIKRKYKLPDKYILSVGHLEPRKNYPGLIDAFFKLSSENKIEHKLVIVGKENRDFREIYDHVNKLETSHSVIFIKFVDKEDLPALYQMADIYITTSTFEGFGFTPLESMAAGRPVVVSNVTSLPEVAGNAALFIDPYNSNDISQKIYSLLSDYELQNDLIQKGYTNIKRFDWENCFSQVVFEINSLLNLK